MGMIEVREAVQLALEVLLSSSESSEELRRQTEVYLRGLSLQDREHLLTTKADIVDARIDRLLLLRRLGFTDKEAYEARLYGFDSPLLRVMIARRAYLIKETELLPEVLRTMGFRRVGACEDKVVQDRSFKELLTELLAWMALNREPAVS